MRILVTSLFALAIGAPVLAAEALQTQVTLDSQSALEYFKTMNVKEETNDVSDRTVHSKQVRVNTPTAGNQLNVRCSYVEKQGKAQDATCTFSFYVNHPDQKAE